MDGLYPYRSDRHRIPGLRSAPGGRHDDMSSHDCDAAAYVITSTLYQSWPLMLQRRCTPRTAPLPDALEPRPCAAQPTERARGAEYERCISRLMGSTYNDLPLGLATTADRPWRASRYPLPYGTLRSSGTAITPEGSPGLVKGSLVNGTREACAVRILALWTVAMAQRRPVQARRRPVFPKQHRRIGSTQAESGGAAFPKSEE
jgi:hypothetical protein